METLQEGGFSNLVTQLKAFFFPKTGGNVGGSVNASGEVTAHETVGGTSISHNLTEKLDEEDYLHGMTWDELEARFTWDDLDGTSSQTEDTETPNLGLLKPGRLSTVGFNGNMDILDTAVGNISTSLASKVGLFGEYRTESGIYTEGSNMFFVIRWYITETEIYMFQIAIGPTINPPDASFFHFYPGGYEPVFKFSVTQ